jgi:hypothetical protein
MIEAVARQSLHARNPPLQPAYVPPSTLFICCHENHHLLKRERALDTLACGNRHEKKVPSHCSPMILFDKSATSIEESMHRVSLGTMARKGTLVVAGSKYE